MELIDPECDSNFFYHLIFDIKNYFDNKFINSDDLLIFNLSHISSNIRKIEDMDGGLILIKLLNNNKIKYSL